MEEQQDINQNQSHGTYHPSHTTVPRSSQSANRRSVASEGSGSGVHWKAFNHNRHRAVFIRDLPFHCTSDDLRKFICSILPSLALSLEEVTVRYGQHGKSLQVAGVLFRDEDSSTLAIEQLHGQRYEGRDLRVSSYNPQAQMETSKVAEIRFSFISLSQTMQRITEAVIREGFEREFGRLQDVGIRLHRVSSDGTQTGYGFMTFHNPEHNQTVAETCRGYEVNQIRFDCSWSSQHGQPEAMDGYDEMASSTPRSQPLSRNASYSRYSSSSVSPIPSSTDAATTSSTSGYPLPIPVTSGHPMHNSEGDMNTSTHYIISAPPPTTTSAYNNNLHKVPQHIPMQTYLSPPSLTTPTSYVPIPPPPTLTNLPSNIPPLPTIMTFHSRTPSHHVPVHALSPSSSSNTNTTTTTTTNNNNSSSNNNNSNNIHSFTTAGLPPPVTSSSSVRTSSGYYMPQQQYVFASQVPPSPSNTASSTPSSAVPMASVTSPNGSLVNPYQFQSSTSSYHQYFYNGYPSPVVSVTGTSTNLVSPSNMIHDQYSVGNNFGTNSNNNNLHHHLSTSNSNSNLGNKNHVDNSLKGSNNSINGDIQNHDINHGVDNIVSNSPQLMSQNVHTSYSHTQSTGNHLHHQYNNSINNNNINNINNASDINKNSNHYSTHTISSSKGSEVYTLAPYNTQPQHQHMQTQQMLSPPPIPQYYQVYNSHPTTYSLSAGYASQATLPQQTSHPPHQQQPGNLVYVYYPNNASSNNNSDNNNNTNFAQNTFSYPSSQPNILINNANGWYPSSSFQQPPNFHPTH